MAKAPKKNRNSSRKAVTTMPDLPAHRAGLPARDSVLTIIEPKPSTMAIPAVSRTRYRIIRTTEMDEYEQGAALPQTAAAARAASAVPDGDNYKGTDRRASKLSIATAKTETFADLEALIRSLPSETAMVKHKPPITTSSTSGRVKEENRNVRVKAFIYAASKEPDNDFHLILGRDPKSTPEMYMTMELSGLPPSNSPSFPRLSEARLAFKKFFDDNLGGNLPGAGYDFPDPPIPVEIEGSLFFDITHATGSSPGPKSLKSRMPVIWEVHPITKLTFADAEPQGPVNLLRTGMPALDSIMEIREFKKGKKTYRTLRTNEVDEYEPAVPKNRLKKRNRIE